MLCGFAILVCGCIPGIHVREDDEAVQQIIREFKEGFLTSPSDYCMSFYSYAEQKDADGWFPLTRKAIIEDTTEFRRYAELNYEDGYAIYCNGGNVRRYNLATGTESEEQVDFDNLYFIKLKTELLESVRDDVLGVIEKNEKYSLLSNWPFYLNAYNLTFCYDVELPLGDEVYAWISVSLTTSKGREMTFSVKADTHNIDDDYDDEGTQIDIWQYNSVANDRCLEAYQEFIDSQASKKL